MIDHLTENVVGKYNERLQTYEDVLSTCWLKVNSYIPTQHEVPPPPLPAPGLPRDQQRPRKVGYAHACKSCYV
jgi:hypothetical protein